MKAPFDYGAAFSRNLGWTTEWEQAALRESRVAIAGLGGVGGVHLLTLSRLGVGRFNIADLDLFDVVNLNRQVGATAESLGRPKVDVLAEMALSINPTLELRRFPGGVDAANVDAFLEGADLYVDGLDFFAFDVRALVFARCAALGIPAVTVAPIGMGAGLLAFRPGGQSFESYFRLDGHPEDERALRFLMGMAPAGLHRSYLVDDTRVDLAARRGPSTAAACQLCAGVAATEALKILLGRGGVPYAPLHLTYDAYRGRLVRSRLPWGNAGPLQRLKRIVARRAYAAMARRPSIPSAPAPRDTLDVVLDAARWAPSGDNTQPWRFERGASVDSLVVHLASEATTNPYEYRGGEPTLLAGGMLLESLRIAASAHGRGLHWSVRGDDPWRIEVSLPEAAVAPSALLAALPMRSVGRRGFGTRPLTQREKAALEEALGPGLRASWFEQRSDRLAVARLGAQATAIRLRLREAYEVHRRVVDWERARSPDGLPVGAIGLDRMTLRMMRWGMARWDRMDRMNRVLGTGLAALQLDVVPGLRSAAFFSIRALEPVPREGRATALLAHGERLQRFWLTATRLGLAMQPALATLAFADHGANGTAFTADERLRARAARLAPEAARVLGPLEGLLFLGRIGQRPDGLPGPRSVRRPLHALVQETGAQNASSPVRQPTE